MKKFYVYWQQISAKQLIWLLTFLSCLIASRIIYIQHGWINDDSVLYFEMARLITIGSWKEALALFNWPLYPLLLSTIHQICHISIQTAAQILDVIFFGITVFNFCRLIQLAGGNNFVVTCGTFILLSSSYIVGDVLPMLLRDQGFWAMFLASLVFFIEFYRTRKLSDAMYWQIFAIFAVLFRVEAITFLLGIPLFLLLPQSNYSLKENSVALIKANLIPLSILLLIACTLIILPSVHLTDFGRLNEVATIVPRMLTAIAQTLKIKAGIISSEVLGGFLKDYGLLGLLVTLISIIIVNICNLLSWPIIGVFALNRGLTTTPLVQKDVRTLLYWVSILAIINACVIIVSVFVLSGRYLIAFILILYIFSAFELADLLNKNLKNSKNNYWQKKLLVLILIVLSLSMIKNILPKQHGYIYEQEAAAYLKTEKIPNEKVFFVSPRLRYYAGSPFAGRGYDYWDFTKQAIENNSIYRFNYLMININMDDKYTERQQYLNNKLTQYKVIKEFFGYKNKKKIILYGKITT